MNTKLAAKAVQFVAASSTLNERLAGELSAYQDKEKQAASKFASVLDLLINTGCVQEHQKQAAADMLGDHSSCLDLLVNAANKLHQQKEAAEKVSDDLGQPVSIKQAQAYDSVNDPYIGRKTTQKKASDTAFERILEDPYA